jgi:hypothetical protein
MKWLLKRFKKVKIKDCWKKIQEVCIVQPKNFHLLFEQEFQVDLILPLIEEDEEDHF